MAGLINGGGGAVANDATFHLPVLARVCSALSAYGGTMRNLYCDRVVVQVSQAARRQQGVLCYLPTRVLCKAWC
eukprot:2391312-Rhodomonas_salina.1